MAAALPQTIHQELDFGPAPTASRCVFSLDLFLGMKCCAAGELVWGHREVHCSGLYLKEPHPQLKNVEPYLYRTSGPQGRIWTLSWQLPCHKQSNQELGFGPAPTSLKCGGQKIRDYH